MPRFIKVAAWIAAIAGVTPILAILGYDALVFQPRMKDIHSFLLAAAPEEKAPPPALIQVTRTALPERNLDAHVARILLWELDAAPSGKSQWHLVSVLWWMFVSVHLSEEEKTTLYLSLSYMGGSEKGFAKASIPIVGDPLSKVSIEQAATLATVAKGPAFYRESPNRLARQASVLAKRARATP